MNKIDYKKFEETLYSIGIKQITLELLDILFHEIVKDGDVEVSNLPEQFYRQLKHVCEVKITRDKTTGNCIIKK